MPAFSQTATAPWAWAQGLAVDAATYQAGDYVSVSTVKADALGNTYFMGLFRGTVTFGTSTYSSVRPATGSGGADDYFVAKRSPSGQWLWAQRIRIGSPSNSFPPQMGIDAAGNAYFGIASVASVVYGTNTSTNTSGSTQLFVGKISGTTGQWEWGVRSRAAGLGGSSNNSKAMDVATNGTVYIGGDFTDSIILGAFTLTNVRTSTSPNTLGFLAAIDTNGQWLWAQKANMTGASADNYITTLSLDGKGRLWAMGTLMNGFGTSASPTTLTLGSTVLNLTATSNSYQLYLAEIDASNGQWAWGTFMGGLSAGVNRLSAGNGKPVVSFDFTGTRQLGSFTLTARNASGDVAVAGLDPNTHTWQWVAQPTGTNGTASSTSVFTDATGTTYLACSYQGANPTTFGSSTLPATSSNLTFVAALDGSGQWQRAIAMQSNPRITSIAVPSPGEVYVGGTYTTSITFSAGFTLTSPVAGTNGFGAKAGTSFALATRRNANALTFEVLPNPAPAGTVRQLQMAQALPNGTVLVWRNILGQELRRQPTAAVVSTANLAAGLYFVSIEAGGQVLGAQRVVIE